MNNKNWKAIVYLAGGAIGLATGVVAAHLYARTAEENRLTDGVPTRIEAGDAFRLGLATLALVRQISDLAVREPQDHR